MKKLLIVFVIGLLVFNVPVIAMDSDSNDDETYVITVKSNPEGVATFSGTMEGLVEGQGYEILYMIVDEAYEFDSWSGGLPMGVFGDEDLELVANFRLIEETFEEEETPESPSVVVGGKNSGIEDDIILDDLLDSETGEVLNDEGLPEAGGVSGAVLISCGGGFIILGLAYRRKGRYIH